MVDENIGTVNLTVGLIGSICGEVKIHFQVSDNSSLTGILYMMLESIQYQPNVWLVSSPGHSQFFNITHRKTLKNWEWPGDEANVWLN